MFKNFFSSESDQFLFVGKIATMVPEQIKPKTLTIVDIYLTAMLVSIKSLGKALNTPIGALFTSQVTEQAIADKRRYFVTARLGLGWRGLGNYTSLPIVVLDELYNIEIEDLVKHRYKKEGRAFMGTREEIMQRVKGLTNTMFDNAKDMEYYRVERLTEYTSKFVTQLDNAQHLFRHWLATQVKLGLITEIDGYVFVDLHPDPRIPNKFIKPKNCEVSDFLYKYYDSMIIGAKFKLCEEFYSAEALAKMLMTKITLHSLGIAQQANLVEIFVPINQLIRDRDTQSSVDKKMFVTEGEALLK